MQNIIYLIINADDLGVSIEINNSIFDLMSRNIVTSSTIIANAPAFEDAAEKIHKYPNNSFGVHLNLTQFKPITSNSDLKPILDDNGKFNGILINSKKDLALRLAVFEEWCAQIKKIQSYGIKVSHIDSHQHVHTIPHLFMVLKKIQKQFGIRKVRISKNIYSSAMPIASKGLKYKKMLWNFLLRKYYPTKTTSGFTSFSTFLDVVKSMKLINRTVEIMVHPGHISNKEETDTLQTSWNNGMPYRIDFINYNDL